MTTTTKPKITQQPMPGAFADTGLPRTLLSGALAGMAASVAMTMFAMIASVTYRTTASSTPCFAFLPSSDHPRR